MCYPTRSFIYALIAIAIGGSTAAAETENVKIALIYAKTGAWESYAKQTQRGLYLGLEYATGGSNKVLGRTIEVIEKDNQLKPDIGKALLEEAFGDDKVDIAVGPISSAVALAMLPVAEEYQKILLVEPATAHSITGKEWNRYVFRTSRNSDHDAIAGAKVIEGENTSVAILTQDYAFGRDGVAAFKVALADTPVKIVAEEYAPTNTTDFTPFILRLFESLKDKPGRKIIYVHWGGGKSPLPAIKDSNPERFDIELSSGGNSLEVLKGYKKLPGMEGAIYYYYELPNNPVNDWLVKKHFDLFDSPPDYFTAGGFAAGVAIVKAMELAGSTETEALIKVMEGMEFDTPKGRMVFRAEDHQALQEMYHYKVTVKPDVEWAVPELVRVLPIEQLPLPLRNK